VVAGGAKLDTCRDVLELTYNSMQCGAIGVDMGRNIWQSEYPAAILQAVKAIIHQGATVKEALDLSDGLSIEANRRKTEFQITEEDIKTTSVH